MIGTDWLRDALNIGVALFAFIGALVVGMQHFKSWLKKTFVAGELDPIKITLNEVLQQQKLTNGTVRAHTVAIAMLQGKVFGGVPIPDITAAGGDGDD